MPNKDGFYPNVDTPEDPAKGVANATKFLSDDKNYGAGTRCMTDCIKGEVPVLRIKNELNDGIKPAPSIVRDMPVVIDERKEVPGRKAYEASCSVCHATDMMGAPKVGDKEVWQDRVDGGLEKLYGNAINGLNGMPPRGGTDLSDDKMKEIVDYMIKVSK
jgi:cytochrome c